jgi:hypothetical protein
MNASREHPRSGLYRDRATPEGGAGSYGGFYRLIWLYEKTLPYDFDFNQKALEVRSTARKLPERNPLTEVSLFSDSV